mmetsp:Transcript_21812/g.51082  ORF Transcript_21812/g.51082 Transcript_21812/m.51082 type:complete len:109 (-) Transcript_21812:128-454(-)
MCVLSWFFGFFEIHQAKTCCSPRPLKQTEPVAFDNHVRQQFLRQASSRYQAPVPPWHLPVDFQVSLVGLCRAVGLLVGLVGVPWKKICAKCHIEAATIYNGPSFSHRC